MSTKTHHTPPTTTPSGDTYERSDITPRPLVLAALVAVAVLALIFVAMWGVTSMFAARVARESPPPNPLAAQFAPKQPPLPRLQTAPVKDLQTLHAAEDKLLHSYAWIDRNAGTVRIPIERAIDLTAERGLPARQPERAGGSQ